MSSVSKVILCTGANRSLGFSILHSTALRLPSAIYLLGSRSIKAGEAAANELKKLGVTAKIEVIQLDITDDASVFAAVEHVKSHYGKLDVLINNAAIAIIASAPDFSDFRTSFNSTFNANITSTALITAAFLPLLHLAPSPKVVNISSVRGSLALASSGKMPPTVAVAYSVSKTALNALTIETQTTEDKGKGGGKVRFFVASPGHLKTAFNGFRGTKDPMDGAEVVVRLVIEEEEGKYRGGTFWEFEEGMMREVDW